MRPEDLDHQTPFDVKTQDVFFGIKYFDNW
jgi:hypothetical protein